MSSHAPRQVVRLSNIDLQLSVRMVVTPIPVGLLVSGIQPVKIGVFAMPFLDPHVIRPIFVIVPGVLVVMLRILVFSLVPMVVLGQCCTRGNCDWSQQSGAQQA
jgi:hypothetical protein